MRLFSKFHDYYDTAVSYGIDPSIIYNRETVEVKNEAFKVVHDYLKGVGRAKNSGNLPVPFGREWEWDTDKGTRAEDDWFWIGFCGRVYFLRRSTRWDAMGNKSEEFTYGPEAVETHRQRKVRNRYRSFYDERSKQVIEEVSKLHGQKNCEDVFVNNRAPVFILHWLSDGNGSRLSLTLNPRLADYEFYKVVAPADAFQQISQFISNDLATQKDPLPLSDKDRQIAHGMDEWSFRNPDPPKRKQKV